MLIANALLVPAWATWETFRDLEDRGLTMYGQMTAGSWIYIGTQGILQGTYETFAAAARRHFGGNLRGRLVVTGRMPHTYATILVDGVELESTFATGRFDGNTATRLFGSDSRLDTLVPRGVPVRVRVVDVRNGQSTAEVIFTR